MKGRIVQKGNVSGIGYDVRITEADGKAYHYHFFKLEDGDSVMNSPNPFNIKGETVILWDELPFKVKEAHCKNIYPNDNLDDYQKKCLLYGKQQTDEAIAAEREKEEKRDAFYSEKAYRFPIYSILAMKLYDEIGWYENVKVVHEKGRFIQFIIDGKYVVKARSFDIISIETKEENETSRKEWGRRISSIAKSAGTSFDFATVVANIAETDKAIGILQLIHATLNSEDFNLYMKCQIMYSDYNTDDWSLKNGIRSFLERVLSSEYVSKLNFSNKFYNAVKGILNNK